MWKCLARDDRKSVHQLEVGCGRMLDQGKPVHDSLAWKSRRRGDREVEERAAWVDPATQRTAGKAEESGQPGVLEPDRGLPFRRDLPEPWLVVRHVEVAGTIEYEVVPHRDHPAACQLRRRLREHLRRGVL